MAPARRRMLHRGVFTLALGAGCLPTAEVGALRGQGTSGLDPTGSTEAGASAGESGEGGSASEASTRGGSSAGPTTGPATGTGGASTGSGGYTSGWATGWQTGTAGETFGGTGDEDPCWWIDEPGPCFDAGCRWSFPDLICHPFEGDGEPPPPLCTPDPKDETCGACAAGLCCAQVLSCAEDPDCACMFNCLKFGNSLFDCQGSCPPSPSGAFLSMCASAECGPMVCG